MLIRRDVWDQLDGFDPNLPLMRDDIDFCWRAHAAGYGVRVVTDAVVYHRELSARHIRKVTAAGGHPRLLDRRGALYVFAANLPVGPMVAIVARCVASSLLRAPYFLLTKQPRRAWDHLGAVAWLLRHPVLLAHARRRRAAGRVPAWQLLRGQLPRGRTLARLAESAAGLLSGGPAYESRGVHQALSDDAADEMPLAPSGSVARRVLASPVVLLGAGLALIALVAERSLTGSVLTGSGPLAGGALVPAWGGASDLWREYLAGYHDAGVGSAASTPPYVAVMAMLATLLAGKPWLAVDVLLLGCVPAAGLTAFLATRRLTSVLAARIWLAATYALLPVAMGAVAAGRIGTVVAFVLLPLIGIAVGRILTGRSAPLPSRFTARRAAWAAGLLIAVAAAFVPLVWLIAVAAAVAAAAAWPWLGRATVINAAIVAAVPAVLLLPWTFHLLASPSALFLEAGLQRPGLAAPGLGPGSVLLLSPGGPGLPPGWVTAGLVLPAFCALLARRRLPLVYTGWAVALAGLVIALAESRVRVTGPGGITVSAWPGPAIAFAAVGLLLAATPVIESAVLALRSLQLRESPDAASPAGAGSPAAPGSPAGARSAVGWPVLAVLGLVVAASAPALAAGYWLAAGIRGPVTEAGPQILPPFVAAASAGPDQARTLVLRPDGAALSYAVLRSTDPVLGEPELTGASSAASELDGVVASLAAAAGGDGGDAGQALRQFDIGYILLPAPVDQALASQLAGAAGLIRLTSAPAYDLWQVAGTVARASVIAPGGAAVPVPSGPVGVNTVLAASTSGTLVLAEAAGGWSAALNGKPLAPLAQPVDGWAQGFVLPAAAAAWSSPGMTRPGTSAWAPRPWPYCWSSRWPCRVPGPPRRLPPRRLPGAAQAQAEPESERAPAAGRRRDRAAGPRPARRTRPPGSPSPPSARAASPVPKAETRPDTPPTQRSGPGRIRPPVTRPGRARLRT